MLFSRPINKTKLLAVAVIITLTGTGCTVNETENTGNQTSNADKIATQETNTDLHSKLPQKIQDSGTLTSVNSGSFPPYTVVDGEGQVTGATADLAKAMGEILDIKIEHESVDGLASILTGMDAGRYDIALGPIGDFPERQKQATFVDWVQEYVVFAVQSGNPKGIESLETTCGKKIAVQAGGSAEAVIKEQSEKCSKDGNPRVEVQSYKDQPSSILAVQSGRSDAFFSSQAPLTYFVQESNGQLELTGTGQKNGFDDLYQGLLVPKDSGMEEAFLGALKILHENGTYDQIMDKWGLSENKLDEPGVNLAR